MMLQMRYNGNCTRASVMALYDKVTTVVRLVARVSSGSIPVTGRCSSSIKRALGMRSWPEGTILASIKRPKKLLSRSQEALMRL